MNKIEIDVAYPNAEIAHYFIPKGKQMIVVEDSAHFGVSVYVVNIEQKN